MKMSTGIIIGGVVTGAMMMMANEMDVHAMSRKTNRFMRKTKRKINRYTRHMGIM